MIEKKKIEIRIKDKDIVFYFSSAKDKNKPILFIFHGHGYNITPAQFISENYNVVCPMDSYGYKGLGSWYLGESGDLFWLEAMPEILRYVREFVGNGRLYMWGSSMGGYASILYGHLLRAHAVYTNIPQTILLGSKYSDNGMLKFFQPIFGDRDSVYNDLRKVINYRTPCKYFLCFNQLEGSNYFMEQGLNFISHLHSLRQPMYIEVRPQSNHAKNHGISESINLFRKFELSK
ncbi:MAG: hypothetical protein OZ916_08385 [Nitrosomonas sp.]|uniref:alpha/beta hydrolase family protein n=1 Tax=Nitrosomonas sp. TaxID=42353 RepID=UPI002B3C54F7|nr:hypothetical protein [Nitrosomonas sp.]MEB2332288.1 hypothetical protein [Nitrosomonas sp.]